ncbi:bpX5 domain-containing protein [Nannocystis radixulma]|uniref:MoxR-vWA-beta-propeller ternary system domain-containing protein n=1 Tax=Nannocystis radixulma TaxID=2995305 RepID=A0ABT5B9K3_9BACT|nr:hypothetical protein [Nannocystis radixulma]MDC0670815.1 hypothetical protein [Nannocystis radixulma]
MTAALRITWSPRAIPLAPAAVVASGPVAARLADRLLTFADDVLLRLRGVAGRDLLVLTGESSDLPWLDGVDYLGRDPLAPGLYIPTTLEPAPAAPLLERALRRRAPQLATPLALLPPPRATTNDPLAGQPASSSSFTPGPESTDPRLHAPAAPPSQVPFVGASPFPARLVSLADARPLARARLRSWRGLA